MPNTRYQFLISIIDFLYECTASLSRPNSNINIQYPHQHPISTPLPNINNSIPGKPTSAQYQYAISILISNINANMNNKMNVRYPISILTSNINIQCQQPFHINTQCQYSIISTPKININIYGPSLGAQLIDDSEIIEADWCVRFGQL